MQVESFSEAQKIPFNFSKFKFHSLLETFYNWEIFFKNKK